MRATRGSGIMKTGFLINANVWGIPERREVMEYELGMGTHSYELRKGYVITPCLCAPDFFRHRGTKAR